MTNVKQSSSLTSGRLLVRNTIWNLLGMLLPIIVGVMVIPPLVHGLGVPSFGVLSLAWIVIGYFSLFDLGIGRALTKLVADKLAVGNEEDIPALSWTSLWLLAAMGVLGSLVTLGVSPSLVHRVLKIPSELQPEALRGFYLLAASIPLVTVTSGLRGILEAHQRFRIVSMIRIPMSIFLFLGPLLVLPFSHSLVAIIAVLVFGRLIAGIVHLLVCFHSIPQLRHGLTGKRTLAVPVLKFGGWMNATNLLSPVIVYFDRFLIGSLLSVSAVTYYTVTFDTVSRISIFPGAMAGVLFPAFATSVLQDPDHAGLLLRRAAKYIFLSVFPIMLVIVAFAPEILRFWLGNVFAANCTTVLRLFAAGVLINCLAQIPFTLVQGAGRPDIPAKLQIIEILPYFIALTLLVKTYGITGASAAWLGRAAVEAIVLFSFAHRMLPQEPSFLSKLIAFASGGLTVLYLGTLPRTFLAKAVFLSVALLAFGIGVWFRGLEPGERVFLLRFRRDRVESLAEHS
jgi:O-antigen/teichoic acid export membrane protein